MRIERLHTQGVVLGNGERLRVSRDFETLGDLKLAYCRVDELQHSRVSIQVDDPTETPRLLVFDGDADVVRALQACCDHARKRLASRRAVAFDRWLLTPCAADFDPTTIPMRHDDNSSCDTLESSEEEEEEEECQIFLRTEAHFDRSAQLTCVSVVVEVTTARSGKMLCSRPPSRNRRSRRSLLRKCAALLSHSSVSSRCRKAALAERALLDAAAAFSSAAAVTARSEEAAAVAVVTPSAQSAKAYTPRTTFEDDGRTPRVKRSPRPTRRLSADAVAILRARPGNTPILPSVVSLLAKRSV